VLTSCGIHFCDTAKSVLSTCEAALEALTRAAQYDFDWRALLSQFVIWVRLHECVQFAVL